MTKRYAVPGLRLGYVTGAPHLLHRLRTNVCPGRSISLPSKQDSTCFPKAIPAGLSMKDYLAECARLKSSLEAIGGLEVWLPILTLCWCACVSKAAALKEYLAVKKGF